MSKLSFVALSLQTTHLDPASVSKVSYVKLVDGNITRQDDVPIIPPTSKKKTADEHAGNSLISWNAALEKLRMMIGKLPIVSYYRDADKEIFQAASRQLNIEPPVLHWLDCRELARNLLPELPDVQLSTVLKTLDLYDDYADSSAVEQTTQIVIALAQRQGVTTVAQLWDELYDQPEDFLGLDSTFQGAADSGSSTDDEEEIDAPLAAEALPLAATAGVFSRSEEKQHAAEPASDETDLEEKTVDDASTDEPITPEDPPTLEEAEQVPSAVEADSNTSVDETAAAVDQLPPMAGSEELPLFLQEPTRDEQEAFEAESAEADDTQDRASDLAGATAATPLAAIDADQDGVDSVDTALNEEERAADSSDSADSTGYEKAEERHAHHTQPPAPETPSEDLAEPADAVAVEPGAEDATEPNEPEDQPASLEEPTHEEPEQQDAEPTEAEQAEPAAEAPDEVASENPQELPDHVGTGDALAGATAAMPAVVPPRSDRSLSEVSTSQAPTVQAVKVSERPRTEEAPRRTSNVNQIFGFVGLFVFGVLSIIGVVLVVMAVMLFFTENSLMLETKIAGVILTLAITLLSLLMTNVSYRSFRKK